MEALRYFKDPRFYWPAGFFVLLELCMQLGLYRPLLSPNSYAENVNRVVRVVSRSSLKPDALILGTSVAYQGVNVRLLNSLLRPENIAVQSGATEGAKLFTQHLIYRSLKKKLPRVKYVVHVSELSFPWTARRHIDYPNLSMIAQFPRSVAFPLLKQYDFRPTWNNWVFLNLRVVTYQRDLRDMILDPLDRVKFVGRRLRAPRSDFAHENKEAFKLSAYPGKTLAQCMASAARGVPEKNALGVRITNKHHRRAVYRTCSLGRGDPSRLPGARGWNRLFFRRLALLHREMHADGKRVLTVFAPYSQLIKGLNADHMLRVWKTNLKEIYGDREFHILDLRHSLDGPNNGDYYYDTIHLNREGANAFTTVLAREILKFIKKSESRPGK